MRPAASAVLVIATLFAAMTGASLGTSCRGDICSNAVDYTRECLGIPDPDDTEVPDAGAIELRDVECTGRTECNARCQLAASCAALTNDSRAPDAKAYKQCFEACEK
jgi:hypothetical protein